MSVYDEFPADRVPVKPDAEISAERIAYVYEREIGKTATGRVWEPSDLDIAYFRQLSRSAE